MASIFFLNISSVLIAQSTQNRITTQQYPKRNNQKVLKKKQPKIPNDIILKGKITDSEDNNPICDVDITIKGDIIKSKSKENGLFEITIPYIYANHFINLIFTLDDYETVVMNIDLKSVKNLSLKMERRYFSGDYCVKNNEKTKN